MYGYEKYLEITGQHILTKVTQEQIFQLVFEKPISLTARYTSPFRTDKNPGTFFSKREDGTLIYIDFGEIDGYTHRSCFQTIMDFNKLSYDNSLRFVADTFNLSYSKEDYDSNLILNTNYNYSKYKERNTNTKSDITYIKSPYDGRDTRHWNQFIIKIEDLISDNVYATHRFFIQKSNEVKKRVYNIFNPCYAIDFIDAVKIYQPLSIDYRFITNCNENHIGNINNIPLIGDKLIIQKAYKDHRVLRNLIPELNVVWFQNEGVIPDDYILINLLERFEKIIIFYDNDYGGVVGAIKLANYLNNIRIDSTKIIHLPNYINKKDSQLKDLGEFVHKEGRKDTVEILKYIKLI